MKRSIKCPSCGYEIEVYKNPIPTVDIIIEVEGGIVLIKRKNPPYGWALPGGFVDYGETLEDAALREAKEETGLDVKLLRQFHAYSDPKRDPRKHTITVVFIAEASGVPAAGDDAADVKVFSPSDIPFGDLVFDHAEIIKDYLERKY